MSQGDSFPPFQGYHIQKIGSKYDQVWQPFLKKFSLLQKDGKTVDDERSLANVSELKKGWDRRRSDSGHGEIGTVTWNPSGRCNKIFRDLLIWYVPLMLI